MPRNLNDDRDRKAFWRYVNQRIQSGHSPSFDWLENGDKERYEMQTGKKREHAWTKGNDPKRKAGIYTCDTSGRCVYLELMGHAGHRYPNKDGINYLGVEQATANMSDGAMHEKAGALYKPTRVVEGIPICENYARAWEQAGKLKPGTVDAAPLCRGWTREHGVIGMDGEPMKIDGPSLTEKGPPNPKKSKK